MPHLPGERLRFTNGLLPNAYVGFNYPRIASVDSTRPAANADSCDETDAAPVRVRCCKVLGAAFWRLVPHTTGVTDAKNTLSPSYRAGQGYRDVRRVWCGDGSSSPPARWRCVAPSGFHR